MVISNMNIEKDREECIQSVTICYLKWALLVGLAGGRWEVMALEPL